MPNGAKMSGANNMQNAVTPERPSNSSQKTVDATRHARAFSPFSSSSLKTGTNAADSAESATSARTIEAGSPAAKQLQPGDRIVSVDGERGDHVDLARAVDKHECAGEQTDGCRAETAARVVVDRDGRREVLEIRPEYDTQLERHRLGFAYATEPVNPSVPEAARISLDFMWQVTSATVSVIVRLFDPEQREQIAREEMLFAEDIADAVHYILTRAHRVDIFDLRIEPRRQDIPARG